MRNLCYNVDTKGIVSTFDSMCVIAHEIMVYMSICKACNGPMAIPIMCGEPACPVSLGQLVIPPFEGLCPQTAAITESQEEPWQTSEAT